MMRADVEVVFCSAVLMREEDFSCTLRTLLYALFFFVYSNFPHVWKEREGRGPMVVTREGEGGQRTYDS